MKSINKQKKYLSENLIVESLRQFGTNKEDVKCFEQALQGSRISDFLIDEAWQADINRDTKVFLVRDRNTREIAFYYALNCGILYKEYKHKDLTPKELELITAYVEAASRAHMNGLTAIDQEAANNLLTKALGDFYEFIEDSERATQLLALADDKVKIKEENAEAKEETGEGEFTKQVQETFPAMDIKFLCRNRNYKPGIELDFKLGIYVFWEIVVPHILKVADLVGCQYVYLFAADNSPGIEKKETEDSLPVMWSEDYDPYSDEEEDIEEDLDVDNDKTAIRKLVSYYIGDLKFRPVSEYVILKPHFERACYTLIQEVSELSKKREMVWLSQDADNEMETYYEI